MEDPVAPEVAVQEVATAAVAEVVIVVVAPVEVLTPAVLPAKPVTLIALLQADRTLRLKSTLTIAQLTTTTVTLTMQ